MIPHRVDDHFTSQCQPVRPSSTTKALAWPTLPPTVVTFPISPPLHAHNLCHACIKATLCQLTTASNRPNARHRTRLSRLSTTNEQEAIAFVAGNTLVIMLLFCVSNTSVESRRLLITTKTLRCQVQAASTVGTPIFLSLLAPSRSVNDSSSLGKHLPRYIKPAVGTSSTTRDVSPRSPFASPTHTSILDASSLKRPNLVLNPIFNTFINMPKAASPAPTEITYGISHIEQSSDSEERMEGPLIAGHRSA